jgi:hypothetical protein
MGPCLRGEKRNNEQRKTGKNDRNSGGSLDKSLITRRKCWNKVKCGSTSQEVVAGACSCNSLSVFRNEMEERKLSDGLNVHALEAFACKD